jgi:hypothetical protein
MKNINIIYPECDTTRRCIFLAGPIQSAPDWHKDAITILTEYSAINDDFDIATPKLINKTVSFHYPAQIAWESKYLKQAAETGVILFWLANPIEEHLDPSRSYAQTTRFEIAEWFGKKVNNPSIQIVVGIEPGFHGARYIKQRFQNDLGIAVYDTLRETCANAYYLLKQKGS